MYRVDPTQTGQFVFSCREGLWRQLARQLPGYLATSVLVNHENSSEVLAIQFWRSLETAVAATESPMGKCLFELLRRMSLDSQNIGLFSFEFTAEKLPD